MRVDPLRFAVLLPTLWAAHNVGDHIAQTHHQATHKANSWAAMAGHISSYQVVQSVAVEGVLATTGLRCSWRAKLLGATVSAATHALLDRGWPVRWIQQHTGSAEFVKLTTPINGMYVSDQALHHGCLLISALFMAVRCG